MVNLIVHVEPILFFFKSSLCVVTHDVWCLSKDFLELNTFVLMSSSIGKTGELQIEEPYSCGSFSFLA